MRTLVIIILGLMLCGCPNNVAKVREGILSMQGHGRDIIASVEEYRSEQPAGASEPPQIAEIDKSAHSIVGDAEVAIKATEGTENKPDALGRVTKLIGYILAGALIVILIVVVIWLRRSFAGQLLSVFRSEPNQIPDGLSRHAANVLYKHKSPP